MKNARLGRWAVLAAVLSLLAAACSTADHPAATSNGGKKVPFPKGIPASKDQGPLTVLLFSGDQLPKYDTVFHQEFPHVKVKYIYGDSNDQFLTKVETGAVKPDIVYGVCANLPEWVGQGLVAPINTAALSNWKDLSPSVEKVGAMNGQQWAAESYYGYDSIVAATNKGPLPTSWKDLWSPQFKGQFDMINYAENAIQMTAVAYGLPYPNLSTSQLTFIRKKLLALAPNVKTLWTAVNDPIQALSTGEVKMFYGWPSQYASIQQAGKIPVTYLNPSEGRLSWTCGAVITANTTHYNLALAWINGRLSAQSQTTLVNSEYAGPANLKALTTANQSVVKNLGYKNAKIFNSSHSESYPPLTAEQKLQQSQLWAQVVSAMGGGG